MKTLNTLIRLHKRTLDELRRRIGDLENQKTQLQQTIQALQNELEREVALSKKQLEMSNFFGEFAKRIKNRQDGIHLEIKAIDKKIVDLNNEIFIAFTDLKKYEIARDNAKQREKEAAGRKETLMLDEIAAQQFQSKNKQSS